MVHGIRGQVLARQQGQAYRGAGKLTEEYNRTIDDIVEGKGLKPLNSKEG